MSGGRTAGALPLLKMKRCALSWLLLACASPPSPKAQAPERVEPTLTVTTISTTPSAVAASPPASVERAYEYDDAARDSDKDGIADPDDRCPTDPGPANANPANHGCPTKVMSEPEGPSVGMMAHLEPGSAKLPSDQGAERINSLADSIIKYKMCALVASHTLTQDPAQLTDAERKLGIARVETVRKLLLKKGLPAARIRLAPNSYPRNDIEQVESPELFRDTVLLLPRQQSECDGPYLP